MEKIPADGNRGSSLSLQGPGNPSNNEMLIFQLIGGGGEGGIPSSAQVWADKIPRLWIPPVTNCAIISYLFRLKGPVACKPKRWLCRMGYLEMSVSLLWLSPS